jgi:hypothetical protein
MGEFLPETALKRPHFSQYALCARRINRHACVKPARRRPHHEAAAIGKGSEEGL